MGGICETVDDPTVFRKKSYDTTEQHHTNSTRSQVQTNIISNTTQFPGQNHDLCEST